MKPHFNCLIRQSISIGALLSILAGTGCVTDSRAQSPRERISINDGWRFHMGDPNGSPKGLIYDVRPDSVDSDYTVADAEPTEADKIERGSAMILKPWIMPSGNRFIKDPAKRYARPEEAPPSEGVVFAEADFDDSSWTLLDLPHDWAISGPFLKDGPYGGMGRLKSWGVAWYRKKLDISAADSGKSIFLDIDGSMSYTTVWLNGNLVGGWPYGYASFRLDLTPYIVPGGENQIAIRLDNPPNSSRWYPGGGIYRNVWLTKTEPVHVAQWGTFATAREVSAESAVVELKVEVDNDSAQALSIGVETRIYELDAEGNRGNKVVAIIPAENVDVAARESAMVSGEVEIKNPRLWGPVPEQTPNRYIAVTSVIQNGVPVDVYETRFGIRSLEFDPDRGLLVNGQLIEIRGVNQHHDLGALGAAFNLRAAERQLEILQEMGCNAIRMAHNPPAPELLELTDRMGFLVMDEVFDVWERKKTDLDFHLIFPEWYEQDLRSLIRRDRNHPSVFAWSFGNEVGEQYTGEDGAKWVKRLHDIVKEEDATRPSTASMNYAKPDMPFPVAMDMITLNYQGEGIRNAPAYAGLQGINTPPLYASFHETFPGKVIVSSENAAALSTRGTYLFPVTDEISAPVKDGAGGDPVAQYVSAYELYTAPFGSSADKVLGTMARNPFVGGGFVWSGWDYLGEPTPYYNARSSYFGIIDLAGFKKDRFYLYQAAWRPDLPMAHILPHWNWPDRVGEITPVHVFTSGDEAELFLNGESLGRKKKGEYEYRLRWDDVAYEPGELKVVAYKNGKKWAEDSVETTGAAAGLSLKPDRKTIAADGTDLSFVTLSVLDKDGRTVPNADNAITFEISGPGEIVATDNGDPTDLNAFPSHDRKAFSGLALVIVKAKPGEAGTITVTARSTGLTTETTTIRCK